jgi:hypothetical protein
MGHTIQVFAGILVFAPIGLVKANAHIL